MDFFAWNRSKTPLLKKILGEKLGFNKMYENTNLGLQILDREVIKLKI
jgi:hypothetical protein